MLKEKLVKVGKYEYELPKEGNMNVPGRIFASEKLMEGVEEKSIEQVKNVAMLPGIIKYSIAMPDVHQGYGFPIGGVAAFDAKDGIISPGGVGYDISCSVRTLQTNLTLKDVEKKKLEIVNALYNAVPSGVGKGTRIKITKQDMINILNKGAEWAIEKGYGKKEDIEKTEEGGRMKDADASEVSERAITRGLQQLGSLGSGNHFLEMQYVEKIFNKEAANIFELKEGQITFMIHCGSRGVGHQIASDYIKMMEDEYGYENLPDRELINAPINSELGKRYWKAMNAAANFAFCNKQVITHFVREAMRKIFPKFEADVVYDICHNIAKMEEYTINGKKVKVCTHRKGATRSYGPGRKELPNVYKKVGQPINIPGSMGTASYILVGTQKAEELSFNSTAHGAGRSMSRSAAIRQFRGEQIKSDLEKQGILIKAGSWKGIVEEAPQAYKDVDEVVRVSHELGIGNLVAKLKPLVVVKG